ncbi:MAG: glycosyltransferase family 4 protein [Sphingomonadales bacterium]
MASRTKPLHGEKAANLEHGRGPHLLHVFPTFAVGGVQVRMASILNHLGDLNRHTIVALDGNFGARTRLAETCAAEFIDPGCSGLSLPSRHRAIRHLLRTRRPDLLLTYNWGAIEWALANRFRPLCRHIHLESGFGVEEALRQVPRRVWMRRIALRNISRLIVPSRTLVDIATRIWRLGPEKVVHIPNGVDCDKFGQEPTAGAAPGFEKRAGELIVGTIAPLRREKNLPRLVRAFSRLDRHRPVRLLIVGDGPERASLETEIQVLDIADKVILAGHVEAPEQVIGWFDIHALSSDTEQMPNTVLQAMAAGKPVAGLRVGDVGDVVSPENRPLIAAAGDGAGLAANLSRLLADRTLRERIGRANTRHVRAHYDQARMFQSYGEALGLLPPDRSALAVDGDKITASA